jgi:hypothetical protein
MKKLAIFCVIVLLILTFSACTPDNDDTTAIVTTAASTETLETIIANPGFSTSAKLIPFIEMQGSWASTDITDQHADDIMPAPGMGPAYRANIHEQGKENPWPSIKTTGFKIIRGTDEATVYYRKYIETKAGETRNNIIKAFIPFKDNNHVDFKSLEIYTTGVPAGITLSIGGNWSGSNSRNAYLVIDVSSGLSTGPYKFDIGILINGDDYGTLPCTINIIPQ